jgi:hypothetical protein
MIVANCPDPGGTVPIFLPLSHLLCPAYVPNLAARDQNSSRLPYDFSYVFAYSATCRQIKWGDSLTKSGHQTYANFTRINWCPYFLILKVGNYEGVKYMKLKILAVAEALSFLHTCCVQ